MSAQRGGVGARWGGMAKGRFQLGNVRVDTESRSGKVRGVWLGNSKIEVKSAPTSITLMQDAGRRLDSLSPLQKGGSRAQYGGRVVQWRLRGPWAS